MANESPAPIIYQEINETILKKIATKYGKVANDHIHTESNSYSLAALNGDDVVGFISVYTRTLTAPLDKEKDAYIDIIEVDEEFQRQGIATELIKHSEKWANNAGLFQLSAWSSQDKIEAVSIWRKLGFGLCPAKIWIEWCKEVVDGYYIVKRLI